MEIFDANRFVQLDIDDHRSNVWFAFLKNEEFTKKTNIQALL
jgi:hypothetical protein